MKKKHRKIFYPVILILGLFLMAWQVTIYRNTIIDLSILFGIILGTGLITFVIDSKNYRKTYKNKSMGLYFYSTIHCVCGFGFLVCSIFMLTNYYFADKASVFEEFKIVERSSLPGGKHHRDERQPTFSIKYNGKMKKLVFPHKFYEKMEFYTNVNLEVRKGYFGYDILVNKKLN